MKTYDEMLDLIRKTAIEDERIRAVTMEGSNVTKGAKHDQYSDFDITFFVTDVREFSNDRDYMNQFGEVLIMQRPEDMWEKLFKFYDYFAELAAFVAQELGFTFDEKETKEVREFMLQRYEGRDAI